MNILLAREFISLYQYAVYSQVRAIFNSLEAEKGFGEITVRYTNRIAKTPVLDNIIFSILDNSNIGEVVQVLSHFRFKKNICIDNNVAFFLVVIVCIT